MPRTLARSGAALAAAAALAAPAGAQAPRYSLDDWMTVSQVQSFVWSPDASTLYYTSNGGDSGTYEIFRIPAGGGQPVQLTRNHAGVRPEPKGDLSLSDDGRTLVFLSAKLYQSYDQIFTLPVTGGVPTAVTFNDAQIHAAPALSPDGRTLAFFARTGRGTRIFVKDLTKPNDWPRVLMTGTPPGERSPIWSPDGRKLAFSRGGDIWIHDLGGGEAKRLIEEAYAGGNGDPVWSPDGTRIAFTTGKSGYGQVGVAEVATGRVTPVTHLAREHAEPSWSPDGRSLVFVRGDSVGMNDEVVVAAADGTGEPRVVSTSRGNHSAPQYSPDGRWIAYIETTGTRTPDVWRVPAAGGQAQQVTRSMGRIDPATLVAAEEVSYPGPDNLALPTILYKPKGFQPGRKYPVLVRFHGHPGQWNNSYETMDQYFAERGFVVIKPNPRGSRGFGAGFHDLHIGDWGEREFDDVMGVLPYLESLGYVDMTRKASEGGSGGGYMSFVVATKAPDAYQAQSIRAPVADFTWMAYDRYAQSGMAWTPTREPIREREEFGGRPDEIPQEYFDRSPINFVEKVKVPQILFQGLRDSSVQPRQSKGWAERMRALGKPNFVYVEYPDEDHSLLRYKASLRDRLWKMTEFYAEHLRLPDLARTTQQR